MKSFVLKNDATQTLASLEPSTRERIREMARAAGLDLPEKLMNELCDAYPAFEAMVRRLPRSRARSDEPAHVPDVARLASLDSAVRREKGV